MLRAFFDLCLKTVCIAAGLCVFATAQAAAPSLIFIPVTVVDDQNSFVRNLRMDDFAIVEGNQRKQIVRLDAGTPLSLGIVADVNRALDKQVVRDSVLELQKDRTPQDEFFVYDTAAAGTAAAFTRSLQVAADSVVVGNARSKIGLTDAIYEALNAMRSAQNTRKTLLVLSDRSSIRSKHEQKEIKARVVGEQVQLICVLLWEEMSRSPDEALWPALLQESSEPSGGRVFAVRADRRGPNEFASVIRHVADEIHNQYVIGFTPAGGSREWRKVRVTVNSPKGQHWHVYTRAGYYGGGGGI